MPQEMPQDLRNYINHHPSCSATLQQEVIGSQGETYVENKSGNMIHAAIRSCRKGSVFRCMWAFNLAPVKGSTLTKRKAIVSRLQELYTAGAVLVECATGLRSDHSGELAEMMRAACGMVGNHGRGAAGRAKPGRPPKHRSPEELAKMQQEWDSRKNLSIKAALSRIAAAGVRNVTQSEMYKRFGKRG